MKHLMVSVTDPNRKHFGFLSPQIKEHRSGAPIMKERFILALQRVEALGIRTRESRLHVSVQAFYWGERVGAGSSILAQVSMAVEC